jgi:SAM-dependent methyltransferase
VNAVDPQRARAFDAFAGEYERFRPGYPDELFEIIADRLQLPERPVVVDLGAGTGRASLPMAERGWRVTAVEPGRPMLDVLRGEATNAGLLLSTVQAGAEATGLDPQSADLVTAAQSFHWFDMDAALVEMARILKPDGGVALFWNVRDGLGHRPLRGGGSGRDRSRLRTPRRGIRVTGGRAPAPRGGDDRRAVHRHGVHRLVRPGGDDPGRPGSVPDRARGPPREASAQRRTAVRRPLSHRPVDRTKERFMTTETEARTGRAGRFDPASYEQRWRDRWEADAL